MKGQTSSGNGGSPRYVMQQGDLPEHLPRVHESYLHGLPAREQVIPHQLADHHVPCYYEI